VYNRCFIWLLCFFFILFQETDTAQHLSLFTCALIIISKLPDATLLGWLVSWLAMLCFETLGYKLCCWFFMFLLLAACLQIAPILTMIALILHSRQCKVRIHELFCKFSPPSSWLWLSCWRLSHDWYYGCQDCLLLVCNHALWLQVSLSQKQKSSFYFPYIFCLQMTVSVLPMISLFMKTLQTIGIAPCRFCYYLFNLKCSFFAYPFCPLLPF